MPVPTRSIFTTLFALVLLASCSSTTIIDSHPTGAKLYIDGAPVGTTPYTYSDTHIVGSTIHLKFTLDGFRDMYASIHRDEDVNVGAAIGGFFVLIPWLWIMDYKPYHNFYLTSLSADSAQRAEAIPAPALEQKLRDLKKMYADSIITKGEYDRLRQRAIDSAK